MKGGQSFRVPTRTWKNECTPEKLGKNHGNIMEFCLFFIDTLPETCLIISPQYYFPLGDTPFVWEVAFASAASSPPNHGYHAPPLNSLLARPCPGTQLITGSGA